VMVAQLVRLALRLLPGQLAYMATSCRSRVTWRFASPHASVASPEPCVWAHALVGAELFVRGGDLSCEAETCRRGCHPSEDWLPCRCRVLMKICMPPWDAAPGGECSPSGCCSQQGYDHPQAAHRLTEVFTLWVMVLLSSSGIILPSKGAPNPGPRHGVSC
jgi:hypothetical protein